MSARIVVVPFDKLRRAAAAQLNVPSAAGAAPAADLINAMQRLQFWQGASGRAYPFTVYGLEECPYQAGAAYVLVRRDGRGQGEALATGRLKAAPDSRNAALRRLGACLGADEIHLHFETEAGTDVNDVAHDIAATGLAGSQPRLDAMPAAGRA